MNDEHGNAQTDREMMRRLAPDNRDGYAPPGVREGLEGAERAEMDSIVDEIMAGLKYSTVDKPGWRAHIREVLVRRVRVANTSYEEVLAKEEMHHHDKVGLHHIDNCRPAYCGRYAGQRRDSRG